MNHKRAVLPCLLFFASSLARLDAGVYPSYSLEEGDQDVRIHTNMHGSLQGKQAAFGDLNHDGRPDAAFMTVLEVATTPTYDSVNSQISLLLGKEGRWPKNMNLVEERYGFYYQFSHAYKNSANNIYVLLEGIADWDGDGWEDVAMFDYRLMAYWGKTDLSVPLDKENESNVALSWPNNFHPRDLAFYAGNLNGDGYQDYVVTDSSPTPGLDSVFVFLGGPSWSGATNVVGTPGVLRWRGYAGCLQGTNPVFDWNHDGFDDLVLNRAGGIDVMWGSANPPADWNAAVSSAPLRLTPSPGWTLAFDLSADQTGDGRKDVVVWESSGTAVRWRRLDGSVINSLSGTIPVENLSPRLLRVAGFADHLEAAGDFDGDGRSDLVWSSTATARTRTLAFLAADQPSTGDWTGGASFSIEGEAGEQDEYHLKDMDRDGKDDLWMIQKPAGGSYRWHINLFYGFRPLKDPSIRVEDREEGSKRATLVLSVDGEPAEMKLSGDIEDEDKDRWIPFAARRHVRLSQRLGGKTVTATFRIAAGRESQPVSVALNVAAEGTRATSVTNRIKGPDAVAEVDCRGTGGRLKATVYERGGRRVKTVADDDVSGVATVRWDGRNDAGERVRPGVYVLVLDNDGHVDRKEILVEP